MIFANGRALVIGIANYHEVSSLHDAVVNDARDVASVLQARDLCGFPADHVQLLLDGDATLANVRAALANLAASARVEDTAVIYFSGHGAQFTEGNSVASALVPVDCTLTDLQGTTLVEAELSAALAAIRAKRLLVLIDACHAGGAGVLKGKIKHEAQLGFDEKSLQRLATGTGRVIIASSRSSETSLVLSGSRNSVFTAQLLEALKGKARTTGDGLIRVFEVFNYVAEQVRGAVPGRQHPIFKASDLEDNFPVALDRGGTKAAGASRGEQPERWRKLDQIMSDLYPSGPTDQEIWSRAGGDLSRLKLTGTGRANWFGALRTLKLGGGGHIDQYSLLDAALDDFPQHPELRALRSCRESGGN
jgi:uncharacterized caspase-like protein